MKAIKFIVCLIVAQSFITIQAQTEIEGGVVSGTWLKSNSPFKINGDIYIESGNMLTIEPGVLIEFQDHYKKEQTDVHQL